mgnify:CR=1 FL=1
MIFTSIAPRKEAEKKFGDYYKTTQSSSFRKKRAVANLNEEISYENLKEHPVSELGNLFSIYNEIDDDDLHKAIVYFCSEYSNAVIEGGDHRVLLNDLKDESNTHATSDFNPWSLVALRELVSDAPEEIEEDLPIFLDILETRCGADSQHEKETWALLGIIYRLAAHSPDAVVRLRTDVVEIFVDVATQSSIALNRALAVATLTRLAETLPRRGRRSIMEHEETLSTLLYDDSSNVQFHMCRLVERTGGFRDEKQQLETLYSLSLYFGFGGVNQNPPINSRLYLAAGRAHAAVNGDMETAERARQFVDQGSNSELFEVDLESAVQELQHPQRIIAEHADSVVVAQSRMPARETEYFSEIARSIRGTPHLVTKLNLATSIGNICDGSAGVISDDIDFTPERNQLETVLSAVPDLWERHQQATLRGMYLLTSVCRLEPDLVESRMETSEFPDMDEIIRKSRIHPDVAGGVSKLLSTFVANAIKSDAISKNTDLFPIIAEHLYDKESDVNVNSPKFCRLTAYLIRDEAMSRGTIRELVSPVSHLINSEESSSATRGHAITVLALIAYRLDDRTLPPTIFNTIRRAVVEKEFGFRFDTEPALAGVLLLAEAEFKIPEDVRDWVTSYLDSPQDVEFHDYETIGELAVRIIGAIGDAEAHRTLDELAVDSNYPIKTRQTAQEILGSYKREE